MRNSCAKRSSLWMNIVWIWNCSTTDDILMMWVAYYNYTGWMVVPRLITRHWYYIDGLLTVIDWQWHQTKSIQLLANRSSSYSLTIFCPLADIGFIWGWCQKGMSLLNFFSISWLYSSFFLAQFNLSTWHRKGNTTKMIINLSWDHHHVVFMLDILVWFLLFCFSLLTVTSYSANLWTSWSLSTNTSDPCKSSSRSLIF